MSTSDAWTSVPTPDGRAMPALLVRPASGSGPGLVLLQEIFGVTDYITSRARDLADLGYTVLVPELYWRQGEHLTTDETTEAGLHEAFGLFSKLDVPQAIDDSVAALAYLRQLPELAAAPASWASASAAV